MVRVKALAWISGGGGNKRSDWNKGGIWGLNGNGK